MAYVQPSSDLRSDVTYVTIQKRVGRVLYTGTSHFTGRLARRPLHLVALASTTGLFVVGHLKRECGALRPHAVLELCELVGGRVEDALEDRA